MNIPLEFEKENKYYVYIKQCNDNLFLYEVYSLDRKNVFYYETFQAFDLGLVEQIVEPPRQSIHPENVIIF